MRKLSTNEQCSKSLYHSIILVGLSGFPYWIMIMPNILGTIIPYNHQSTNRGFETWDDACNSQICPFTCSTVSWPCAQEIEWGILQEFLGHPQPTWKHKTRSNMYVYLYIHMHMHIHIHIYIHMHMHIHIHIYIYMSVYIHMYIYVYIYIYIYICICMCICICICIMYMYQKIKIHVKNVCIYISKW